MQGSGAEGPQSEAGGEELRKTGGGGLFQPEGTAGKLFSLQRRWEFQADLCHFWGSRGRVSASLQAGAEQLCSQDAPLERGPGGQVARCSGLRSGDHRAQELVEKVSFLGKCQSLPCSRPQGHIRRPPRGSVSLSFWWDNACPTSLTRCPRGPKEVTQVPMDGL